MTTFWSTWICVLTIGSLIGLTWLLFGTRKGETKYGHELSKILFEAVRLGLISTNQLN